MPTMAVQASCTWVADQFISKFYDVLHKHPNFVSYFYKDTSTLSVSVDQRPPSIAQGDLQAIQNLISQTVASAECFPQHIDSMYSINGGVILQVVGWLKLQDKERKYIQTFFLATQEHGFYVLNDMLRVFPPTKEPMFVDDMPQPVAGPISALPPSLANPATQEEVPPYVPSLKLLQEMQAANNRFAPATNGPPQQPSDQPPRMPPPVPSPAPPLSTPDISAPAAPAVASQGPRPEAAVPPVPMPPAHPQQQPAPAQQREAQPAVKGGRGTSPVPSTPSQPSKPAHAPTQVPCIPTPPPNMSLADRLKFIEQHKQLQAAHAAQAQQQAQQQAAQARPAQQQQAQQTEPQQIEPQREDRPSRPAQQQQQRQQRQQQQQQQGGPASKGAKAEQQQQQQPQHQEAINQKPIANGNNAGAGAPPVHGVYVRNLPQGDELSQALLEEHFGQFGVLKAMGEGSAVTIHASPKHGKVAYIKFEQASSVKAAMEAPPTIGTKRCEVLTMHSEYVNGPQPGTRGPATARGGFRSSGHRRGGSRFGEGGRPPRSGGGGGGGSAGAASAAGGGAERQGSPSFTPSSRDPNSSLAERPPRSAGGGSGRGGGGGRRSRSGSASRPKREQAGGGSQPTYVPVNPKS